MTADLLVVGAGPAGLATAIAASLQGLRATVADSRRPPIDKTCGEGLLPEAVAALRGLGVILSQPLAYPFNGIRFTDEESSVCASLPEGTAFGLRRTTLNQLLIERALEVGVTLLWGARVSSFDSEGATIDGARHPFRWLVGADGRDSAVRKWARLNKPSPRRLRFGFRRHYSIAPWTDVVEVYWGERCQMVVTPTNAEEICISALTSDPQMRIERMLPQFPLLAQRLQDAPKVTTEQGALTVLETARGVVRGNIALAGDAAGTVDAISGQGLSLAFQQAKSLGEALARGDLNYYRMAHERICKNHLRLNRLLLLMCHSALIRRKTLRLFANSPGFFAGLMLLHTGQQGREVIKAKEILDLGWRVLWA
jgi:flavin-dependent dehydrogenase